ALQCALLPDVRAGLLLLRDDAAQSYVPAAVWPDRARDVNYLARAAQRVVEQRGAVALGAEAADRQGVAAGSVHVAYPVQLDGDVQGIVVLDLQSRPAGELQAAQRQLLWGAGWLEALLRRHQVARNAESLERAAAALDLVQAAQEQSRFDGAAM